MRVLCKEIPDGKSLWMAVGVGSDCALRGDGDDSRCAQSLSPPSSTLTGKMVIIPDGLVEGADGNFYGTTPYGGANCYVNGRANGTVFKVNLAGDLTRLTYFCALTQCADGMLAQWSTSARSNGKFYGTRFRRGTGGHGAGTVFEITTAGSLTNLHNFESTPTAAARKG